MRNQTPIRILLAVCVLVTLLLAAASAQVSSSSNTKSGDASSQTSQSQAQMPTDNQPAADDNAQEPEAPRNFFGEAIGGHFMVDGEASFRQSYDDNAFASSLFRFSDNVSMFSGRISWSVQQRRMVFQAHYAPSYRMNARFDNRNAFSQQISGAVQYDFSGRSQMDWSVSFADASTNGAPPFSFATVNGTQVPVFHPDLIQPDVRVQSLRSGVSLTHKFTARSGVSMGLHGGWSSFSGLNNSALPAGRSRDNYTAGAVAAWNYEIVAGKKIGVEVGSTYFGFIEPSLHSFYQTAKARYEQKVIGGLQFSVGAGPSFRVGQSGGDVRTGYVFDVGLSKLTARGSFGGQYGNDERLGTTLGGFTSSHAVVYVSRNFHRRWVGGGSFTYSRNRSPNFPDILEGYAAAAHLGYSLTPSLQLDGGYNYVNQSGRNGPFFGRGFDRNLFSFGVVYNVGALLRR